MLCESAGGENMRQDNIADNTFLSLFLAHPVGVCVGVCVCVSLFTLHHVSQSYIALPVAVPSLAYPVPRVIVESLLSHQSSTLIVAQVVRLRTVFVPENVGYAFYQQALPHVGIAGPVVDCALGGARWRQLRR